MAIATHPRIYAPPTPSAKAIEAVEACLESSSLVLLAEGEGYWLRLRDALVSGRASGPLAHDARVVALCRLHGVRELWSVDHDFSRFPDLRVRNSLVA